MGIPVPSSQFCYEPKTDLKKNNSALKRWKRGSLQRTSFTSNTKLCFFHPRLAFMFKSSRLAISPCLEKLTPSPLSPCSSLNPWPQTKSGHRSPRRGQNPWRRLKCLSPKQIWENECEDASFKDRIRWLCRPATISKQKRYLKIWKQLCSAGGWGWGTVRQNQGMLILLVWDKLKRSSVPLMKVPSEVQQYDGNHIYSKRKRGSCGLWRGWGMVKGCLGISRGVTADQSSNSRRHSVKVQKISGTAERDQGLGSFLKRKKVLQMKS